MKVLLQISGIPSSTYYWIKRFDRPDSNVELAGLIRTIYDEHEGLYGYPRIRDELTNRGHKVNHKKVYLIMKELGLKCLARMKKYRSYKGKVGKIVTSKPKNQMKRGLRTLRRLNYLEKSYIYRQYGIYLMVK
ncbi:hypothetical protein CN372_13790 [Bacillus anthracis]|nr:hypothetical protein CN372_13790 [Bacillus anthracis]